MMEKLINEHLEFIEKLEKDYELAKYRLTRFISDGRTLDKDERDFVSRLTRHIEHLNCNISLVTHDMKDLKTKLERKTRRQDTDVVGFDIVRFR